VSISQNDKSRPAGAAGPADCAGGDSGIGRAVALAFAREGADVAIAYLDEDDDARETAALAEKAGRRAAPIPGDLTRKEDWVKAALPHLGAVASIINTSSLGRPGEPKELAPVYALLAPDEASYVSGAVIPVTGGKPIL
jgi:NAD(P)-dependent dehydrogenase (short-subunit alcohol dehydrogenase family)